MSRLTLSLFLTLALHLQACGSEAPSASLEPLGGDIVATGDSADDDLATTDDAHTDGNNPSPDGQCTPICLDKECGSDGCGGTCGTCGAGMNCHNGSCSLGCDSPQCTLGKSCAFVDGTPALCGGTITFNHTLEGKPLNENVSVETLFAQAGVFFYTPSNDAVIATNQWDLQSTSGGNSCASIDKYGQPWREPVFVRFAKPVADGAFQGATHFVSLYVGDTWPGGIAVDFYGPGSVPGNPGATPFHSILTDGQGTDFIEYGSGDPIGYLVIHAADDPDFTIDDLTFGPLYVP